MHVIVLLYMMTWSNTLVYSCDFFCVFFFVFCVVWYLLTCFIFRCNWCKDWICEMNMYVCTCDLCYVNSAIDSVFDKQRVSTLTCSVLLYRQEYSNPDHLPLRTTALTPADGDIRERAHKLCCEYLRGAWKRATAQDFVIRKVRYVYALYVITDLFSSRTKVTQNCLQASSVYARDPGGLVLFQVKRSCLSTHHEGI